MDVTITSLLPTKKKSSVDSSEPLRPSGLGFRTRLKPFIPFIDKPASFWSTSDLMQHAPLPLEKSGILDIIRSWFQACDKGHGKCCHLRPNISLAGSGPRWLVDVRRSCLVPAMPDMKYFALSYVWGRSTQFCATNANIDNFQKDQALSELGSIPQTIQHAMQLVAVLEERFLWVDCLCILQDDGAHKEDQLNSMGDIYSGAIATIVAANGDNADVGLTAMFGGSGVQHHSTPQTSVTQASVLSFRARSRSDVYRRPGTTRSLPLPGTQPHIEHIDEQTSPTSLEGEPGSAPSERYHSTSPTELDFEDNGVCDYDAGIQADGVSMETPRFFIPRIDSGITYCEVDGSSSDTFTPNNRLGNNELPRKNEDIMLDQALELTESKWYSRGWTFQEQLFSPRKIIFQGQTINWECGYAAWTAAQGIVPLDPNIVSAQRYDEGELFKFFGLVEAAIPLPDFRRLARLISLYNQRDLKYPEDVLNAFAGIIKKLTPQYSGGFITGLPQMLFDSALLWQPYSPLIRRVAKKQAGPAGEVACLPSWSWVGWNGDIHTESWRSGYDFMKGNPDEFYEGDESIWQQTSWKTIPTVEWFRMEDDGSKHRIHANGQQHREGALLESVSNIPPLPRGWTRHKCPKSGKDFFRHEADPSREFWYPIPLGDIPNAGDMTLPQIQCRFLWCRTRRAFLKVGNSFQNELTSRCVCIDLLDETDNWAGVLRYHVRWRTQAMQSVTQVELIELSAGSVLDQGTEEVSFDEWFRNCPCGSDGKYEFYNVMAIEWVEGVAYRKAVGRVKKEMWVRLATEEVEVLLS